MSSPEPSLDDLTIRRRRIRYRACHRGIKEMDIILGGFADQFADELDAETLNRLEVLMDEPDTELLKWILGHIDIPPHVDHALVAELRRFQAERSLTS